MLGAGVVKVEPGEYEGRRLAFSARVGFSSDDLLMSTIRLEPERRRFFFFLPMKGKQIGGGGGGGGGDIVGLGWPRQRHSSLKTVAV
jgi:hypothetical protein